MSWIDPESVAAWPGDVVLDGASSPKPLVDTLAGAQTQLDIVGSLPPKMCLQRRVSARAILRMHQLIERGWFAPELTLLEAEQRAIAGRQPEPLALQIPLPQPILCSMDRTLEARTHLPQLVLRKPLLVHVDQRSGEADEPAERITLDGRPRTKPAPLAARALHAHLHVIGSAGADVLRECRSGTLSSSSA